MRDGYAEEGLNKGRVMRTKTVHDRVDLLGYRKTLCFSNETRIITSNIASFECFGPLGMPLKTDNGNTMRQTAFFATLVAFVLGVQCSVFAQTKKEITIERIPHSVEEFIEMRNSISKTPEGGAAMFLAAMLGYSENKPLGRKFFTIALHRGELVKGNDYKGFSPNRGLEYHLSRYKDHWPYAYFKSATIENGYQLDPPFLVSTSRDKRSGEDASGKVKIYVDVAGFRPRGITVRVNDKGIWKASSVSSFFLDIPLPQNPDDL